MLIGVIGDNAAELGGYRTHNPFRLYCRQRFKEFILTVPDARVLVALRPGVGQWLAEVCLELRRPYEVARQDPWPSSWPINIRQALDALTQKAARIFLAKDVNAYVRDEVIDTISESSRVAFAARLMGKTGGAIWDSVLMLNDAGINVANLYPEAMPPAYDALGCIEEAREIVPDNFSTRLRESAGRLQRIIDQGKLAEGKAAKVAHRMEQMLLLAEVADAFCVRSGG